jgi:uncharacterized protein (DUF3084 family)
MCLVFAAFYTRLLVAHAHALDGGTSKSMQVQSRLDGEQHALRQRLEQLQAQQVALQQREAAVVQREEMCSEQDASIRAMAAEVSASRSNAEASLTEAQRLREQVDKDMALLQVRSGPAYRHQQHRNRRMLVATSATSDCALLQQCFRCLLPSLDTGWTVCLLCRSGLRRQKRQSRQRGSC